jgi:uncharacterized protein (TIGR00369 family)
LNDTPLTDAELSRLRESINRVPYALLLGINFEDATRGAATLSLGARPELERFGGIMHGGAIASLADSASAFAVLSTLDEDEQTVTVDLTLHYLRPVTAGKLTAHARVLRAGRRVATVSVEVFNEAGALVVTALTTYLKIR